MREQQTETGRGIHRRHTSQGPRCITTGRVQITDICKDVKTLSQILLLCERRFANAISSGDVLKAGHWAAVGEAVLAALRPAKK
jgi:hypothetical protein